jgi:hypothetical protein
MLTTGSTNTTISMPSYSGESKERVSVLPVHIVTSDQTLRAAAWPTQFCLAESVDDDPYLVSLAVGHYFWEAVM